MASVLKSGRGGCSLYYLLGNAKVDATLSIVRGLFCSRPGASKISGIKDNTRCLQEDGLWDKGNDVSGEIRKKKRLTFSQKSNAPFLELARTHKSFTVDEWQREKSNFRNAANFESQLMCFCSNQGNLSLGRSLMEFIKRTSLEPNLVTRSKYLRLLGDCRMDNSEDIAEEELLKLYAKIVGDGHKILDANTVEDVIHGICSTSIWRESIPLMDKVQNAALATRTLLRVVIAAFRHHELEMGWELLDKAAAAPNMPQLDLCFRELIKSCERVPSGDKQRMMDRMLYFIRRHEIFVSEEVAEDIRNFFERQFEEGWQGRWTSVSKRGICQTCNSRLEDINLNDEEFSKLRDNFINRVIEGKDVFLKTFPKELEKFKEFVQKTAPYSVVLDGLNVAYAQHPNIRNPTILAKQLLSVVKHFAQMNEDSKILVLGKQHMLKWPKDYINAIKRECFLYTVDNLSEDDPYLLYAALFSGQGTMLISKDMMRDHLYNLHNFTLASYFRKWLRGHQVELVRVKDNGEVVLKHSLNHNPVAQASALQWHIPYENGQLRPSNEVPNSWLCLRKMKIGS